MIDATVTQKRPDYDQIFWRQNRLPYIVPQQPILTCRVPGVSRNAKCPCGSGAKFRKCCRQQAKGEVRFNGPFRGTRGRPW